MRGDRKVISLKMALPLMPPDCSMTNWFYNLIKAKPAREGGGDKQGGAGSSEHGMQFCIFPTDPVRTDTDLS